MKANAAVFTVIFPANLPLIEDFVYSLNNQSSRTFEVIVANDGVHDPEKYLKKLEVPYSVFAVSGTPASIRQQGIDFLRRSRYEHIIFADSDDRLGVNRVEVSINTLEQFPIVCNDLDLMTWDGNIYEHGYWGERLSHGAEIDKQFLVDKNIVGLGNTAVRRTVLKSIDIPSGLIAVDWFLFYRFLGLDKVMFTSQCKSIYRQHPNNTIGLDKISADRIRGVVKAKKLHYAALLKVGEKHDQYMRRVLSLEERLTDEGFLNECAILLNSKSINYFWWEETNYLT